MERPGNGNRMVQYLLGQLPEDERLRFDEQLITNADYSERLMATEDELIDDYLLGRLSASERGQFERTFLSNPFLRKRVALAKALLDYIDSRVVGTEARDSLHLRHGLRNISSQPDVRRNEPQVGTEARTHGLRNYRVSLVVIAVFRVAILALIWFFIHWASFASIFNSPVIYSFFSILIALYLPLEVVSLFRAARDANLALAEGPSETDPT